MLTAKALATAHVNEYSESSRVCCFLFPSVGDSAVGSLYGVTWVFCPCRGRDWALLAGNWWDFCIFAIWLDLIFVWPVGDLFLCLQHFECNTAFSSSRWGTTFIAAHNHLKYTFIKALCAKVRWSEEASIF